jgi:hypothetical protein
VDESRSSIIYTCCTSKRRTSKGSLRVYNMIFKLHNACALPPLVWQLFWQTHMLLHNRILCS